ncbi:MAG: Maf family protein, partial [Bdellovibrionaceae bacterium]|nr:Maf family protein [Pseudobdellovibrionaceae bacterium]
MDSIVLASTSKYRASQMRQLAIPFQQMTPSFDEEIFKGKGYSPLALARLLAAGKAKSLSHLGCTVIAADQLVSFEGEILGKPGCRAKAIETLQRMAGREHELITALCVLCLLYTS